MSELGEDTTEVWNKDEKDELLNDLKRVTQNHRMMFILTQLHQRPKLLSKWITIFLFFIQASYKLSSAAVSAFLKFLQNFLTVFGLFSAIAKHIAQCLFSSLYTASRFRNKLTFWKYIVCKKCH